MMRFVTLLVMASVFVSCKDEEANSSKLFRRVLSPETGITFSNDLSEKNLNIIQYLYYYNGGGVAAGDINNDGLVDLFFTGNETSNRLYLNKGSFKFEDITQQANLSTSDEWSTGVTMADVNNDGWLDIFVCQVGNFKGLSGSNKLFLNNHDLTFTESSQSSGLSFSGFSTQSAFFDYDNDGDLDMFLLTHSVHSVRSYGNAKLRFEKDSLGGDRLYRNRLEKGKLWFEDVTDTAGIYSSHIGYGLGVSVADVNVDGFPDIYVSNDFHENDYLYINKKNGTFSEELEKWTSHTSRYAMGNDIADIDGDGLPDIVAVDMLPDDPAILLKSASEDAQEVSDIKKGFGYGDQYVRNTLQINRGDHFSELGQVAGIHASDWSWCPLVADFDNDGLNDIFITNGIVKRPNDLDYIQYYASMSAPGSNQLEIEREKALISKLPTLKIGNRTYRNSGDLKFTDVSAAWGLDEPSYSNGAAYADLDNDGDLDLVMNNINEEAFVFENMASKNGNNFLTISLSHPSNKFALGAKVVVHSAGKSLYREVLSSRGFQSSVSPVVHFGLGKTQSVDSVEVYWPGEGRQVSHRITIGVLNEIKFATDSITTTPYSAKQRRNMISLAPGRIDWSHRENRNFKDYAMEPLVPYMLSREGPAVAVADVNKDGRDDIFFGATPGTSGNLFIQDLSGSFNSVDVPSFKNENLFEDVDAAFFDANGDGWVDLYVVTAGNEYPQGHRLLRDRFYINKGNGLLEEASDRLPKLALNGSCVRAADFDGDGDQDLFVGTRNIPGDYGLDPESIFLRNTGGRFEIFQTMKLGMVTDAEWFDHDGDGRPELAVVGDWMPVSVLKLVNEKFKGIDVGLGDTNGWWRSVSIQDMNNDGLPDIIAGNIGVNFRMKPSQKEPVTLYLNDFDDNGKTDPVIFFYQQHAEIPLQTKAQLGKQIPPLNKRFNSFLKFSAGKKPEDFLPAKKIENSSRKIASTFETQLFLNNKNGTYHNVPLPHEINWSSVNDIIVDDMDQNGLPDILVGGNTCSNTVTIGAADAQTLSVLLQQSSGVFEYGSLTSSDNFRHCVRAIKRINHAGADRALVVTNDGPALLYETSKNKRNTSN